MQKIGAFCLKLVQNVVLFGDVIDKSYNAFSQPRKNQTTFVSLEETND